MSEHWHNPDQTATTPAPRPPPAICSRCGQEFDAVWSDDRGQWVDGAQRFHRAKCGLYCIEGNVPGYHTGPSCRQCR